MGNGRGGGASKTIFVSDSTEPEVFSDGEGDPDDDGRRKSQLCPRCLSNLEFEMFGYPKRKNSTVCISCKVIWNLEDLSLPDAESSGWQRRLEVVRAELDELAVQWRAVLLQLVLPRIVGKTVLAGRARLPKSHTTLVVRA